MVDHCLSWYDHVQTMVNQGSSIRPNSDHGQNPQSSSTMVKQCIFTVQRVHFDYGYTMVGNEIPWSDMVQYGLG